MDTRETVRQSPAMEMMQVNFQDFAFGLLALLHSLIKSNNPIDRLIDPRVWACLLFDANSLFSKVILCLDPTFYIKLDIICLIVASDQEKDVHSTMRMSVPFATANAY